ncbi:MAG: hypothetical protein AAF208_13575 [Cyanobacteria bacterium P01_A01_bin.45]
MGKFKGFGENKKENKKRIQVQYLTEKDGDDYQTALDAKRIFYEGFNNVQLVKLIFPNNGYLIGAVHVHLGKTDTKLHAGARWVKKHNIDSYMKGDGVWDMPQYLIDKFCGDVHEKSKNAQLIIVNS